MIDFYSPEIFLECHMNENSKIYMNVGKYHGWYGFVSSFF